MKSIEISVQILGGMGKGLSKIGSVVSPLWQCQVPHSTTIPWTHIQFGANEVKEFGPKMTCEICIAENMVHENLCD